MNAPAPSSRPVKRFDTRSGLRIYRIACKVLPGLVGRVHLVLGAEWPILVDTGSGRGSCTRHILTGFESVRSQFGESFGLSDIRRILITHSHIDHIGGLASMVRRTRASVGVHPLDAPPIRDYDEYAVVQGRKTDSFLRSTGVADDLRPQLMDWFGLAKGRVRSARIDFSLNDGDEVDGLRVIHTPGHSAGHICLLCGDILLAADHILPVTVPQQWPECLQPYTGLGHYLESLDKIARLPGIELALGGHEQPTREVYHRIEQIRQTQFRRLDRALDLLTKATEPLSIVELAERMYTHTHGIHRVLAIMDAASRVEYHYQRARLRIVNLDDFERNPQTICRFRPA